MRTLWNQASLLALSTLLALAFNLGSTANAATSSSVKQNSSDVTIKTHDQKKTSKKTVTKKASAKKTVSKKAVVKKTTEEKTVIKKQLVKKTSDKKNTAARRSTRTSAHPAAQAKVQPKLTRVVLRDTGHGHIAPPHRTSHNAIAPLTNHANLQSEVAFVQDLNSSAVLYDKNSDEVRPIASISKLMTAIVIAEAHQPMNQIMEITEDDVDHLRHSRSRLTVGTRLSRADMLHLALMSSENRAAHALARYYPGGVPAFVRAMNDKARALGMRKTHFIEPTGLSSSNVSSPRDLVKLLTAAYKHPVIHQYTTDDKYEITVGKGRRLMYNNSNGLVRKGGWNIQISKTGFINEAGECLVMLTRIGERELAIILLNSTGRYSRIGDAMRIRHLVESETNVAMM